MSLCWRAFAIVGVLTLLAGCESSGTTTYRVSAGYYSGPGWYDPFYYRPCCYDGVIVVPPPGYRPPPGHRPPPPPGQRPPPGARPPRPTPLPSIPSRPRPMPRTRR